MIARTDGSLNGALVRGSVRKYLMFVKVYSGGPHE
jgi:hypothetical protein